MKLLYILALDERGCMLMLEPKARIIQHSSGPNFEAIKIEYLHVNGSTLRTWIECMPHGDGITPTPLISPQNPGRIAYGEH